MNQPSDELIARVIRSKPADMPGMMAGLPEMIRAQLAVFCNARTHLRAHGRAIAATCGHFSLSSVGGAAGAALFDQAQRPEIEVASSRAGQPITLALIRGASPGLSTEAAR